MWPNSGQSAGELRRFLITREDLGVCWSADNSGRTAGVRDAGEDRDEDDNRAGGPAGPPSASVVSRSHMTMMACRRSTHGPSPSCARPGTGRRNIQRSRWSPPARASDRPRPTTSAHDDSPLTLPPRAGAVVGLSLVAGDHPKAPPRLRAGRADDLAGHGSTDHGRPLTRSRLRPRLRPRLSPRGRQGLNRSLPPDRLLAERSRDASYLLPRAGDRVEPTGLHIAQHFGNGRPVTAPLPLAGRRGVYDPFVLTWWLLPTIASPEGGPFPVAQLPRSPGRRSSNRTPG